MKCFIPIPSDYRSLGIVPWTVALGPRKKREVVQPLLSQGQCEFQGREQQLLLLIKIWNRQDSSRFFQAQIVRAFRECNLYLSLSKVHCERTKVRCYHLLVDIFQKHRSSKFSEKNKTHHNLPACFPTPKTSPTTSSPVFREIPGACRAENVCCCLRHFGVPRRVSRWVGLEGPRRWWDSLVSFKKQIDGFFVLLLGCI